MLTSEGARTGLITTEGSEDTLLVTRGAYGRWSGLTEEGIKNPVRTDRAPALVEDRCDRRRARTRRLRRRGGRGADLVAAGVRFLVEEKKVEAIAVSFLWSFFNPGHERAVRDLIGKVAAGPCHAVERHQPVPGEYERLRRRSSTPMPDGSRGLPELAEAAAWRERLSGPDHGHAGYGGLLPAGEAAERAVGMIECVRPPASSARNFWAS